MISRLRSFGWIVASWVLTAGGLGAAETVTLIPGNSSWRFLPGLAEASAPDRTMWRGAGFDDSAWSVRWGTFYYGESGYSGTLLEDMQGRYSTFYLRKTVTVPDVAGMSELYLRAVCDDGFAMWINGKLAVVYNAPVSDLRYNSTAGSAVPEPVTYEYYALGLASNFLVSGVNVVAVQVLNVSQASSDLVFDLELGAEVYREVPPSVATMQPLAGVVGSLTSVTVTFTEDVVGVQARDLLLNGVGALQVSGSGRVYTFEYAPPALGGVQASWYPLNEIRSVATPVRGLDHSGPGMTWAYELVSPQAPRVNGWHPPPGLTVRALSEVEVWFDQPVRGVDASDLAIDGVSATNVTGIGAGPYVFQFAPVSAGAVQVSWLADHGVVADSFYAPVFEGGSWGYRVAPESEWGLVRINEIMAENVSGLLDEDGERTDWVELHNAGPTAVNLDGWSMTDDAAWPGQWVFPAVTLPAGGYLVVHASAKDRRPAGGGRLHLNFKLGMDGEYLGLCSPDGPRTVVDEMAPGYPGQRADRTYGLDPDGVWRYFATPTPGTANGTSDVVGVVEEVEFSVPRCVFIGRFQLSLHCATPGAVIRYTFDGSTPSEEHGLIYKEPMWIDRDRVIRVVGFKAGHLPTRVQTSSYLRSLSVRGSPPLPIISLVTDAHHLYGPSGIMEYNPLNTVNRGLAWERPVSMEFLTTDGDGDFQVDCGIRVAGGGYVRPLYRYDTSELPWSKYSFRLYFRGDYGPGRLRYPLFSETTLEDFDTITLRAGMNDPVNPFIRDEMVRRLASDVGQVSSRGMLAYVYLNGGYRGYYNPCERIDRDFLRSYHGGTNDWDLIGPFGEVLSGDLTAWNGLRSFINTRNLTTDDNYLELGRRLDLVNFIDYLLPQIYADNDDWPHNNWRVARERVADGRFRFYVWDAEWAFGYQGNAPSHNTIANQLSSLSPPWGTTEIQRIFNGLKQVPEFQLLFADRVHRHMFNGGALTDERIRARYEELKGDAIQVIGNFNDTIGSTWIPARRAHVLQHLAQAGFLGSSNAPVLSAFGGVVPVGYEVEMTSMNGVIYYTTDGSDPRVTFSGVVAPGALAYGGPIRLSESVLIKARTLSGTTWSALSEATFQVATVRVPLAITELGYNPPGGDAYEFIELCNTGSVPIALADYTLEGVDFRFASDTPALAGGRYLVLASANQPAAFSTRYPGVTVAGYFGGSLSNGGERIAVLDPDGRVVVAVTYGDDPPWPVEADGAGATLEIVNPDGDPDDPANWKASRDPGGSPGRVNPAGSQGLVRLNEIMAVNVSAVEHAGTYPDWIELYNDGEEAVDLSGWSLTDNEDPRRFTFPAGTIMAAASHLIVWCDNVIAAPGLHAGFALDRAGETVALYDAVGRRVDAVTFGPQIPNYTIGRTKDGNDWVLGEPTPGSENEMAVVGSQADLAVNEFLAAPLPGGEDWLELHNLDGDRPVALAGLHVGTGSSLYQIRVPAFVEPAGFVQWIAENRPGPNQLGLKLPAGGGVIELTGVTGERVDRLEYDLQSAGVSVGRLPDGTGMMVSFPGSASPGASNYLVSWSGPVLNELMARNGSTRYDPTGRASDWIELHHPQEGAFDLSGMTLAIGSDVTERWSFPTGSTLEPGGHVLVWCSAEWPASTEVVGALNTGWSLPGNGGRIRLMDALGQVVDTVDYGFQVQDRSIGRSEGGWQLLSDATPGGLNAMPAVLGDPGRLRINEWFAAATGEEDWFELFNPELEPVALAGLLLTDDPSVLGHDKHVVGPLSFIGPRDFVLWVADGQPQDGPGHVDFSLNRNGELVRLSSSLRSIIDTVYFQSQYEGVSEGRLPDGAPQVMRFPETPTPGRSNYLPMRDVVINEVLTHTDPPLEDAVELGNRGVLPIDVSGWYLSNSERDFTRFRIPDGTSIPPAGYLVLYEGQFNSAPGTAQSFGLNSARGEDLHLSAVGADGQLSGYRAVARVGAAANGVSFGRHVTSIGVDYVALQQRTFGVDEPSTLEEFRAGSGASNVAPLIGPVIVNELMYRPAVWMDGEWIEDGEDEFIELYNVTGAEVDLFDPVHPQNAWRIGDGVRFTFPEGTRLGAGGYLLVVRFDPESRPDRLAAFRQRYAVPSEVAIIGPYEGRLSNSGEAIELLRPDKPQGMNQPDAGYVPYLLVDRVDYRNGGSWPAGSDAGETSLQRRGAHLYGNEPFHWVALPASAGRTNVTAEELDTDGDGMPDEWETRHGLDRYDAADAFVDGDGDGKTNLEEYLAGTNPIDDEDVLALDLDVTDEVQWLRFRARPNRSYTVQFSFEPEAGLWFRLADVVAEEALREVEIEIPEGPVGATRFYRVVLPMQP